MAAISSYRFRVNETIIMSRLISEFYIYYMNMKCTPEMFSMINNLVDYSYLKHNDAIALRYDASIISQVVLSIATQTISESTWYSVLAFLVLYVLFVNELLPTIRPESRPTFRSINARLASLPYPTSAAWKISLCRAKPWLHQAITFPLAWYRLLSIYKVTAMLFLLFSLLPHVNKELLVRIL